MLLAAITIILVIAGVFAFINVRRNAAEEARRVAREVATRITEQHANEYMQQHLPEIAAAYSELMAGAEGATGPQGDEIAEEESS